MADETKNNKHNDDSKEQKIKEKDPERDISPQREDNSRPKQK
ncbi:hypothetical protein [Oceanobacillus damuensis]|nr:hypothetical protein [Oceanobacillus damuensis]